MTFSSLISGTIPHYGKYGARGRPVTRVIEHHWAGKTGGIERLSNPNQKASANYLILSDGRILGQVPEEFRPWTSGGPTADGPSITIECQNSSLGPNWEVSDAALNSIIRLLADIANRHAFVSLSGSTYRGHREFAPTACPGPYLWDRMQFIRDSANALREGNVTPVINPITPAPVDSGYDNKGYTDEWIAAQQSKLIQLGYDLGLSGADGKRGAKTIAAVTAFQQKIGLDADGIPGPATSNALDRALTPAVAPVTPSKPNCTALQRAVRTADDNAWGSNTDMHCDAIREASAWGGNDFPFGVKFTQRVVGTPDDGSWGNNSRSAHDATVRNVQMALKSMGFDPGGVDGKWGDNTERAYQAARNACHI